MTGDEKYFSPAVGTPEGDAQVDAINAIGVRFEDGGWLSTMVWNTRNAYCTWPEMHFPASQVRMIVEGFLAEISRREVDGLLGVDDLAAGAMAPLLQHWFTEGRNGTPEKWYVAYGVMLVEKLQEAGFRIVRAR